MNINLLKLDFKNIRDFRELTIPLFKEKDVNTPFHISLIQMPNGTGKTTAINLLRSIVCGEILEKEIVLSYQPTRYKCDEGYFGVLLIIDRDLYSLGMHFDYRNGVMKYETSRPKEVGGGKSFSYDLPPYIRNVMTKNFTRLFVFDGEFSENILDNKKTEAETSIKFLYFLDRLELLKIKADTLLENKRKSTKDTKVHTQQGLTKLETEEKKLKQTLVDLNKQLKKFKEESVSTSQEIEDLEKKNDELLSENETIQAEFIEFTTKISSLENDIRNGTNIILNILRTPSQFSLKMNDKLKNLSENMSKLKLPRSVSSEFFKELSDEDECICGRPILNDSIKKKILEKAEQYLAADHITTTNCIKGSIRNMDDYKELSNLRDNLYSYINEKQQLIQAKDLLKLRLDEKDQEKAEKIKQEIIRLSSNLVDLNLYIQSLETKNSAFQEEFSLNEYENINLCQKKLIEKRKRLDEASDTVNFSNGVSLFKKMMDNIISSSIDKIKEDLISKSNTRISQLMGNKDVVLEKIEGCIYVDGKKGVSQGQSLAVAYAFLSTLFEDSPHKVPFIVDSPVGSLDLKVRREVSDLIPKLFAQLIVFIISSERNGFVEGIGKYEDVQFLTIYKDERETGSIAFHTDKKFFMQFHSENEEVQV